MIKATTNITKNKILAANDEIILYDGLFTPEDNSNYFNLLLEEVSWQQEKIKMFGKEFNIPRLTAWYGDIGKSYSYSGINNKPIQWTENLFYLKSIVESTTGEKFNSCLINYYRDGKDSVNWHQDNEKELGPQPSIASLTFGGEREFQLRLINDKKNKISLPLGKGKLLLMAGDTQSNWEHQIPKTKKNVEPRINLTFRNILSE